MRLAEHALPCWTRMRRLDEIIGHVAQRALIVGQGKIGRIPAEGHGCFRADPLMHVLMIEHIARAAEIVADAADPKHQRQNEKWSAHPNGRSGCRQAPEESGAQESGACPPAAAAARCRPLFRSTVSAGFFSVPFDPD